MSAPSTKTAIAATPASQVWAAVSDCLESFAQAWEQNTTPPTPPEVNDYLPLQPIEIRRLVLVELIKLDIDQRITQNIDRPLEDYVRQFPELGPSGPPADLIYEDYHLRRKAGRGISGAEYARRFPNQAVELARLLGGTAPARSTAVFGAKAPVSIRPGEQLDDFDLLALLGEGQFAKVFLARQRTMQRLVALKVSAQRGSEAQTLAQLDHPHIVRVYDQRFLPERRVQLVYMPYLAGGTFQEVVAHVRTVPPDKRSGKTLLEAVDASLVRRGEIPQHGSSLRQAWTARSWPATVCALGAKLAAALDYAHRQGVLHRDVKPANVLLTAEGEPLLADFNVGCCSKLEGAGPASFFGGTLPYMSAEHLEAFNPDDPREVESLDGRADIFGLAVTLWELLTGERPFSNEVLQESWPETLEALVVQRRAGPLPSAVALLSDGDVPGLREILQRCLAANADHRPANAGELARELELCLLPATRRLVRPSPSVWHSFVMHHLLWVIYPAAIAPNILGSLFNISYNRAEIIAHWPSAESVFDSIILAVNGIFFPLGMILFAIVIWPVHRGLKQIRQGVSLSEAERTVLRTKALRLGEWTAGICVGCWLVAGLVWPIFLSLMAGAPPQGAGVYIHFLLSLVVCGMIAAAYPYFIVTALSVRVLFPSLLGSGGLTGSDNDALQRVERELGRYRAAATAVPLFAVALLASRGVSHPFAVAILSITGLAGAVLAFSLEGRTRSDLAALKQIPGRD